MATHSIKRISSVSSRSKATHTSLLARALLLALLCSHVSTVTASPLPSLPASAPGFESGAVSGIHDDAIPEPWIDSSELNPGLPAIDLDSGEDEDWDLGSEDMANGDEGMGVDGMGNAIAKGFDSSTRPPPPNPSDAEIGPLTLPESLLASFSRILEPGFWKGLLGSFLVLCVLITTTLGALVVVAVRVRRMGRSGELLERWHVGEEMRGRRRKGGEGEGG